MQNVYTTSFALPLTVLTSVLATPVQIVSKVENQEGMENFDDILFQSDAIMVGATN